LKEIEIPNVSIVAMVCSGFKEPNSIDLKIKEASWVSSIILAEVIVEVKFLANFVNSKTPEVLG
jgi:hypothetical protein